MKIVTGSHKLGVLNPDHHSAFLSPQNLVEMKLADNGKDNGNPAVRDFWLHPGEVALMHNWVIHCSGLNSTMHPRRALSISYMDARSKMAKETFDAALGGELTSTGYPEGGMNFPLVFEAADGKKLQTQTTYRFAPDARASAIKALAARNCIVCLLEKV